MNVFITGAAGGLGRALALACAQNGYNLFLTDVNEAGLNAIAEGVIKQYGVLVHTKACNLSERGEVKALFDHIDALELRFDMLLNVAGIDFEGGFMSLEAHKAPDIVRLNVEATLDVTHRIIERKRQDDKLYIVFVSSLASLYPIPLKATYAASKRFLLDFSIALSHELSARNISVMALCPGGLPTTPEAMSGIEAQGLWGLLTTNRLEAVTRNTLKLALRGRRVYIPGVVNRVLGLCSKIVPQNIIAKILFERWNRAQNKWLAVN